MKILVLRFSSIGDIVLTTPVLRCLKQQLPGLELHVATRTPYADLVAHSPHVDKVHTLDDDLGDLIARLKAERFDHIVDLHHNLRTARIKSRLGVKSTSFPKLNIEKWLLVNFRVDRMPAVHIVDRYLSTVAHLGVKNDGQGLELFIPKDREVDLSTLPEQHRSGYVALAVGAAHSTKRMPAFKLKELAQRVAGPIVIIGGPDEVPLGREIADAVGARAFNATGKYDLLGSASLIRQARSVIAHDSGAMHVACAFQRPVVCVWGNTVPAFGMGPYQPLHPEQVHNMEVPGLECRPCSKLGHDKCPKGHFNCMEKQDLGRIASLVNQRN
jgi:ADP-heptose:LPS heptosyltransferase